MLAAQGSAFPTDGSSFWSEIFRNPNPVEIEIGPGTGIFVLTAAERRPDTNFLAIELSISRARAVEKLVLERRLANVIVVRTDATYPLAELIPAASVQAIHIYFPDPWWKRRHQRRRIFTPAFVDSLANVLTPGGYVYIATDVAMVFSLMQSELQACPRLQEDPHKPSPRLTVTAFENKGLLRGATIRQSAFLKKTTDKRA